MRRETKSRRTREEIVSDLREVIADPDSTEEQRLFAEDRLRQYEQLGSTTRSKEASTGAVRKLRQGQIRRVGRFAAYALGVCLVLDILLMASGYRLLISEKVVDQGEAYTAGDWVFGSNRRAVIVCRYWTGRSMKPEGLWYGVGDNEIDECPLLYAPGNGT